MPSEEPPSRKGQEEPDNQMPRDQLLPLIISQLQQYGLNSIAKVVAEGSGTPFSLEPSCRLAELAQAGVIAAGQEFGEIDVPDEIMPTDLSDDEMDATEGLIIPEAGSCSTELHRLVYYSTQGAMYDSSLDGKYAATASTDMSLKVIDVSRVKANYRGLTDEKPVIRTLYDHLAVVNEVIFHPNGTVVASCSDDQTIKLYDLQKPAIKRGFRWFQDACAVRSIHFHPSGDFLLAGTEHEAIRIHDVHTLKTFSASNAADNHTAGINKVRYAQQGGTFASCSDDGSIKIWDTVSGRCTRTIPAAHGGRPVTSIRNARNGRYLLSVGRDSLGKLWDLGSGKAMVEFAGAEAGRFAPAISFDYSEDLVLAPDDATGAVVFWDSRTGELLKKIPAHSQPIINIAASPTEPAYITCSDDFRARFWGADVPPAS
ncbi:cleavage stimulation factor, 3' pre-RNA, subunit 1 [Borealophlyctis nickersoniae]|nr:cleavage stimulation factor, 3' pre-RNA, subunit 1 [Borealophlyctis nickersoniae]